jgi:hypothetical protein
MIKTGQQPELDHRVVEGFLIFLCQLGHFRGQNQYAAGDGDHAHYQKRLGPQDMLAERNLDGVQDLDEYDDEQDAVE